MIYDVIIIGAGPAGMSAGIYSCRKELKTLILSKDVGGQTAKSWNIENYLGYNLVSGAELAVKFKEHLESFKCLQLVSGVGVASVNKGKNIFLVSTKNGKSYQAKSLIIASGKIPKNLDVPGEAEFNGRGITYCAICDAPLFRGKAVAVIGGGNSALDAVYQLLKISPRIHIIIRGNGFSAGIDNALRDKVIKSKNVKILFNSQVLKVFGEKLVNGLSYKSKGDKKIKKLAVGGVFVEIGSTPAVDFCKDLIRLNQWNEIIINEFNATSVEGIFAAGDVTNVIEKQTIIAAGEGAKAAISASKYLSSLSQ